MKNSFRNIEVNLPKAVLTIGEVNNVRLSGNVYGDLESARVVYMVVGGITASSIPFGQQGWWNALLSADLIDLSQDAVICPSMPGNGSSWQGLSDFTPGDELPRLSVADLADLVALWTDGIGVNQPVRYIGASFGGLIGLSLAIRRPHLVARLVTISAGMRPDGWGTGCRHLQRELVRQSAKLGRTAAGMSWARQLGMLTYRGRDELNHRFGTLQASEALPPVASYLAHNGEKFAAEFPATTFLLLSEAIDRMDAKPQDLTSIDAEVAVVGVPGDLLFPWDLQVELHRKLREASVASSLWALESEYGHDAFLVEQEKLAGLLRDSEMFREGEKRNNNKFRPAYLEPVKTVRLGMIGCGVVGQGLLELLALQKEDLKTHHNVQYEVTRIAVQNVAKKRAHIPPGVIIGDSALEVATASDVDVVVEVAGGLEVAAAVEAALAARKPVVTANKVLVGRELPRLAAMASRMRTSISCEAAAAAAIPIVRALNHRADEVLSLAGIVNGTCNYVITRMQQDEMSQDEAIVLAQSLGLAEADPSADIEGKDAACKLTILVYRCFGVWISPDDFDCEGIAELTTADCELAERMGMRIRHLVHASRSDGEVRASVLPMVLPDWHLLAGVEEEYNSVYLSFKNSGDLSLFGKGAGGLPTASALIGDLIELAGGGVTPWPAPNRITNPKPSDSGELYFRVSTNGEAVMDKKIESHIRRLGGVVRNKVSTSYGEQVESAFIVGELRWDNRQKLKESVSSLARVTSVLVLSMLR